MADFETSVKLSLALQAYMARKATDTTSNVDTLIQRSNLRKTSLDSLFPAMFSLHGLDIATALSRAVKDKDITKNAADVALVAINKAMEDMSNRYPVLDSGTFTLISSSIHNFINIFNEGGIDSINKDKLARLDLAMLQVKELFKQPYIVSYFEGSSDKVASIKIAHNSFSNLRTIVNNRIKEQVLLELSANKITNSKLRDSTFLTTKIINWGHTQADNSIITGKLLAELLSAKNVLSQVSNKNEIVSIVVKDFLEETGQEKTVIKLHQGELTKGDSDVLTLVINSGLFQSVVVQNRRQNQEDLGQLEKKWNILDAIARKNLLTVFKVNSINGLVSKLLKVRSSPSLLEKLEQTIISSLSGKVPKKTAKTIPLLNATKKIVKKKKKVQVKNTSTSLGLRRDTGGSVVVTNLVSLQALLDAKLAQQIKDNMGDGSRRDVLNLRSGRLAESAKVERLSESRAGMITAFYSYMKNPYATFSDGGRQQYPRSRDPKALISKSIREIAATQVSNRLRAVLV